MVSTYLSYDLVTRDLRSSMNRTANQAEVQRNTEYYKENIGKVASVDEFFDDYRLYTYAMTAYGLEDMIYAKAFMKKVLESDLSDSSSFANSLTDDRYKNFARAFQFSKGTEVPMTTTQLDDAIGLYNQRIEDLDTEIQAETGYFNAMMTRVKSVDEFLSNDRLREYFFTAFGIDGEYYNRDLYRGLLTSNLEDEDSYFNTVVLPKATAANETVSTNAQTLSDITARQTALNTISKLEALPDTLASMTDEVEKAELLAQYGLTSESEIPGAIATQQALVDGYNATLPPVGTETAALVKQLNAQNSGLASELALYAGYQNIVMAFQFNGDGTVPVTGAMSDENLKVINENYVFSQERLTTTGALLNDEYVRSVINTFETVEDMLADSRVLTYIRAAFGLSTYAAVVNSTIEYAITSDPDDPDSYLNQNYKGRDYYSNLVALARFFNFQEDGTLADGDVPIDAEKLDTLSSRYFSGYNDKDEEADEAAIDALKAAIDSFKSEDGKIENVDDLLNNKSVYDFALRAVGLEDEDVPKRIMKQVLMSDINDPKSFVYTLKDDRYVQFARLFNFDSEGDLTWAAMAQSELTMQNYASQYIINLTKVADKDKKEQVKSDAEKESSYFQEKIASIETLDELLADRRLIDVVLVAKGLDPDEVTDEYIQKMFASDLDDPKSFANTEPDYRFAEIVASFNFNAEGKVIRPNGDALQSEGDILETVNLYLRQTIETDQGETSTGVRLALYFERVAPTITDAYDLLSDEALLEVFRTTFGFSTEFSNMDIDQQAKYVEKNLKIADLSDPETLKKFITRFTAMYDAENNTASDPKLLLFQNGGSAGISADLMLSIATLKSG